MNSTKSKYSFRILSSSDEKIIYLYRDNLYIIELADMEQPKINIRYESLANPEE